MKKLKIIYLFIFIPFTSYSQIFKLLFAEKELNKIDIVKNDYNLKSYQYISDHSLKPDTIISYNNENLPFVLISEINYKRKENKLIIASNTVLIIYEFDNFGKIISMEANNIPPYDTTEFYDFSKKNYVYDSLHRLSKIIVNEDNYIAEPMSVAYTDSSWFPSSFNLKKEDRDVIMVREPSYSGYKYIMRSELSDDRLEEIRAEFGDTLNNEQIINKFGNTEVIGYIIITILKNGNIKEEIHNKTFWDPSFSDTINKSEEILYDKDFNVLEEIIFNSDGHQIRSTKYEYDSFGKEISIQFNNEGKKLTHLLDKNGNYLKKYSKDSFSEFTYTNDKLIRIVEKLNDGNPFIFAIYSY